MTGPDPYHHESGALVNLLFNTTHAVLTAEEIILADGIWCDVVPRPAGISDFLCGLAIEIRRSDLETTSSRLKEAGLVFEIFSAEPF
ncbi:MAG: DUF3343 domain-containing protein [Actinobacteria bacterium]|nr:DUF3343 domain-containing protein [Actinomycetota bacterium]